MRVMKCILGVLAVALMIVPVLADTNTAEMSKNQNVVSFDSAGLLPEGLTPKVEINLTSAVLKVAVATTKGMSEATSQKGKDAEQIQEAIRAVSDLIESMGLQRLQVCVFDRIPANRQAEVQQRSDAAVNALMNDGWTPMIHVPETHVSVISKEQDGRLRGFITVIAQGPQYIIANLSVDADPECFGESLGTLLGKATNGSLSMDQIMKMAQGMQTASGATCNTPVMPSPAKTNVTVGADQKQ